MDGGAGRADRQQRRRATRLSPTELPASACWRHTLARPGSSRPRRTWAEASQRSRPLRRTAATCSPLADGAPSEPGRRLERPGEIIALAAGRGWTKSMLGLIRPPDGAPRRSWAGFLEHKLQWTAARLASTTAGAGVLQKASGKLLPAAPLHPHARRLALLLPDTVHGRWTVMTARQWTQWRQHWALAGSGPCGCAAPPSMKQGRTADLENWMQAATAGPRQTSHQAGPPGVQLPPGSGRRHHPAIA